MTDQYRIRKGLRFARELAITSWEAEKRKQAYCDLLAEMTLHPHNDEVIAEKCDKVSAGLRCVDTIQSMIRANSSLADSRFIVEVSNANWCRCAGQN